MSKMLSVGRVSTVVVVGLVLSACSAEDRREEPGLPAFSSRVALPSCGETTNRKSPKSTIEDLYPQSAVSCLTDSRRRGGAEFRVTVHTDEGDPVTTFYRTEHDSSDVEVFLDRSAGRRHRCDR